MVSSPKPRRWLASFILLGIVAFVIAGITLESRIGIPFDTTYRVGCAGLCLYCIFKLGSDYPGERWVQTSFWVALFVNAAIFFTPLVDRPTSRGELILFALPDIVVVLVARIASYSVVDVHQRAMRQQMILGLVVAVALGAALLAATIFQAQSAH